MPENVPERPELRPLDVKRVVQHGQELLLLSDPRHLAGEALLVPQALGGYLALANGARTIPEIASAARLLGAPPVAGDALRRMFSQLDRLMMIENGAYAAEMARRLCEYRSAPSRPPALAGGVYQPEPGALTRQLEGYAEGRSFNGPSGGGDLALILSPHIDYARGGRCYAETWGKASEALRDVELAVIFGTDHNGAGPRLTLTEQSYGTPWGVLPTDARLVRQIAEALGQDRELPGHAFQDEANHIIEHSVELAAVWLHHAAGRRPVRVVPVLCGSMHGFVSHGAAPDGVAHIAEAVAVMREAASRQRTVFIAAADLAHVGPEFGDPAAFGDAERARVEADDRALLDAVASGDRRSFLSRVRANGDANRICGLAPMYMALWAVEGAVRGEWFGYEQCPADADGGSFVSIAGALVYRDRKG